MNEKISPKIYCEISINKKKKQKKFLEIDKLPISMLNTTISLKREKN